MLWWWRTTLSAVLLLSFATCHAEDDAYADNGSVHTRSIRATLNEIERFIRKDDAQDRSETDTVARILAGRLRADETEQGRYLKEVFATRDEAVSLEGHVAASASFLDALHAELEYAHASQAVLEAECTMEAERNERKQKEIGDSRALLTPLIEDLRASQLSPFEEDPCNIRGPAKTKGLCNNVTFCEDPKKCASCVFDANQPLCFSAAATLGTKALNAIDIEQAMGSVVVLLNDLEAQQAALDLRISQSQTTADACGKAEMHRLKASAITTQTNDFITETREKKDSAEAKRSRVDHAQPFVHQYVETVTADRVQVQHVANAYQARRNARVTAMLCQTASLRRELAGDTEASEAVHLPGSEQYPGATLPPVDSSGECAPTSAVNAATAGSLLAPHDAHPAYSHENVLDNEWAGLTTTHEEPLRRVDVLKA